MTVRQISIPSRNSAGRKSCLDISDCMFVIARFTRDISFEYNCIILSKTSKMQKKSGIKFSTCFGFYSFIRFCELRTEQCEEKETQNRKS